MMKTITRRTALRTLGGGLTLGGLTAIASADSDELANELNGVTAATQNYRDVSSARADGYIPASPYVPGQGFHFAGGRPPEGEEDGPPIFGSERENPPTLVYFTNGSYNPEPGDPHNPNHDDDLILGAVEYIVPGDQTDDPPDLFSDENATRALKVSEEEGWHFEAPEAVDLTFTTLHAWVHRGNPAGVFHRTNPTID